MERVPIVTPQSEVDCFFVAVSITREGSLSDAVRLNPGRSLESAAAIRNLLRR